MMEKFSLNERIISRNSDLEGPTRLPDFTAPDLFLWGYLKDRAYAHKPHNIQQLKETIHAEIPDINENTLASKQAKCYQCL